MSKRVLKINELKDGMCFLIKLPGDMKNHLKQVATNFEVLEKEKKKSQYKGEEIEFDESGTLMATDYIKKQNKDEQNSQTIEQEVEEEKYKIHVGDLILSKQNNSNDQTIDMFLKKYDELEKQFKQNNKMENQFERLPSYVQEINDLTNPEQTQKIDESKYELRYQVLDDQYNHPIYKVTEQNKNINKVKYGEQDAYVVHEYLKKRDRKKNYKMIQRLKQSLILKPVEMDGATPKQSTIMRKFHQQRKTELIESEQIALDDDYDMNYRLYNPNGEDSDSRENDDYDSDLNGSENSDTIINPKNKPNKKYYYQRDIRVAKKDDEIQSDIQDMFLSDLSRTKWTWEDIKNYNNDQPETALKRIVEHMCDKVDGVRKGGLVEYQLKDKWKK